MKTSSSPAAYLPSSNARIAFISLLSGAAVAWVVLFAQWIIYNDWMHRAGPLRVIGTIVSGTLTAVFVWWWLCAQRQRQLENISRFETIARMNDRIRNCLQAIAYATYVERPDAIDPVWEAVDRIDEVLREVLVQMQPESEMPKESGATRARVSNTSP
jgi:hypothetical protein